MPKYNGHKNWNHWNVSLWINNDEGLYNAARECISTTPTKSAAVEKMFQRVQGFHCAGDNIRSGRTPDGAPYSLSSVRAAMVEM